jgi:hypothetical protein
MVTEFDLDNQRIEREIKSTNKKLQKNLELLL